MNIFIILKQRQNELGFCKNRCFLIVMTEPWLLVKDFKNWYYINDVIHVSFYNTATFEFIRREYGFIMNETGDSRVFLLEKTIWNKQVIAAN